MVKAVWSDCHHVPGILCTFGASVCTARRVLRASELQVWNTIGTCKDTIGTYKDTIDTCKDMIGTCKDTIDTCTISTRSRPTLRPDAIWLYEVTLGHGSIPACFIAEWSRRFRIQYMFDVEIGRRDAMDDVGWCELRFVYINKTRRKISSSPRNRGRTGGIPTQVQIPLSLC